jgi:hypothetical protein
MVSGREECLSYFKWRLGSLLCMLHLGIAIKGWELWDHADQARTVQLIVRLACFKLGIDPVGIFQACIKLWLIPPIRMCARFDPTQVRLDAVHEWPRQYKTTRPQRYSKIQKCAPAPGIYACQTVFPACLIALLPAPFRVPNPKFSAILPVVACLSTPFSQLVIPSLPLPHLTKPSPDHQLSVMNPQNPPQRPKPLLPRRR